MRLIAPESNVCLSRNRSLFCLSMWPFYLSSQAGKNVNKTLENNLTLLQSDDLANSKTSPSRYALGIYLQYKP